MSQIMIVIEKEKREEERKRKENKDIEEGEMILTRLMMIAITDN